jgi:hypothetical protein
VVQPEGTTTLSTSPDRVRISMHDMAPLIEMRVQEGVAWLNEAGARLTERSAKEAGSPGYAADWLRWRERLDELRRIRTWGEEGEPNLNPEPPAPTRRALETHLALVRDREEAAREDERLRVELQEMRARGAAEREALLAEARQREREQEQPATLQVEHVWQVNGWGGPVWGSPGWGHRPGWRPRPPHRPPNKPSPPNNDRPTGRPGNEWITRGGNTGFPPLVERGF